MGETQTKDTLPQREDQPARNVTFITSAFMQDEGLTEL